MSNNPNMVAHVRWEMPFPILLPSYVFLCWEPVEGVAAFVPEGQIGSLQWHRTSTFFSPKEIFGENPIVQNPASFPKENYRMASINNRTKKEITTLELFGGPEGGFKEARPYSIANIFLYIRSGPKRDEIDVGIRANAALNNLIDVYRLLSLDPYLRKMGDDDHYDTIITYATLPDHLMDLPAGDALLHIEELKFSAMIGEGRVSKIGLDSLEDLRGYGLDNENKRRFFAQVKFNIELELFHVLIFSAIRRLKRKEESLAIIDAQSAFESAIESMLRDGLQKEGWTNEKIDRELKYRGKLCFLTPRLCELDRIASAFGSDKFDGSQVEADWNAHLYEIRNEVVHKGRRQVTFEEAKRGIVACLKAISFINFMCPNFQRKIMWVGQALELPHINETAGRLTRIFET